MLAWLVVVGHVCEAGNDPRHQGSCVRCGRPIPPPITPAITPAPPLDLCDPVFETQATLVAARQAGVDGQALGAFADARKQVGPVRDHLTRDFRQEVAEELSDGRNYVVWWLEQARADDTLTAEKQWHLMQALGSIAVAWHHISQTDR